MKIIIGKIFQLIGLTQVLFGLFYGFRGDMIRELYLFLAGLLIFILGRWMEKRQ
ncbi:hypothetical protein IIA15_08555 [candidate division TA06 bacterium]|nr:hypothetical protein [candidate division TA06 bacterium]